MYVCMYVCMYVHMYVCNVCMYVYMYVRMYDLTCFSWAYQDLSSFCEGDTVLDGHRVIGVKLLAVALGE